MCYDLFYRTLGKARQTAIQTLELVPPPWRAGGRGTPLGTIILISDITALYGVSCLRDIRIARIESIHAF